MATTSDTCLESIQQRVHPASIRYREDGGQIVTFIVRRALSCGAYGYPLAEAADVSIRAVRQELGEVAFELTVSWVLWDPAAYDEWKSVLDRPSS